MKRQGKGGLGRRKKREERIRHKRREADGKGGEHKERQDRRGCG